MADNKTKSPSAHSGLLFISHSSQIGEWWGFLTGNSAIHQLINGGFFLHENHTFVSLTPPCYSKCCIK